MRWLITIKPQADLKQLDRDLLSIGCQRMSDEPPLPLGQEEQVVEVEAPENLREALEKGAYSEKRVEIETEIICINPSSDMRLY